MTISQSGQGFWTRGIAMIFSLVTAVAYFIMAFGFVPEDYKAPPAPLLFVAGLAYLVGGLLILRVGRRLMRIGAVLNLLVLLIFSISLVTGNVTIDALSVSSKVGQLGLEVMLIWIVISQSSEREP